MLQAGALVISHRWIARREDPEDRALVCQMVLSKELRKRMEPKTIGRVDTLLECSHGLRHGLRAEHPGWGNGGVDVVRLGMGAAEVNR